MGGGGDESRYARVWREAMAMATRTGVRDRATREDLAQEVTVRAWRSGRDERPWLLAVMRHCAADHHRAASRCVSGVDLDAPSREGAKMQPIEADAARGAGLTRAPPTPPPAPRRVDPGGAGGASVRRRVRRR